MESPALSNGTARSADTLCRAIVYAHLAGVGAFSLGSYLDGSAVSRNFIFGGFAALFGLSALVACPMLAMWLSITKRLNGHAKAILLVLTCIIESLQLLAMMPLVQ